MGAIGRYPTPNPRVISTTDGRPVESYIDSGVFPELFELVSMYLRHEAYEFVVNWSKGHDNFLPDKSIKMYFSTADLISSLLLYEDIRSKIPPEDLKVFIADLPDSEWFVHPTYPLSILDVS